jgi:hypothetical protein
MPGSNGSNKARMGTGCAQGKYTSRPAHPACRILRVSSKLLASRVTSDGPASPRQQGGSKVAGAV